MAGKMRAKRRVMIGKIGLDGHTTGIYVVSKALSNAGMEVIFAGIRLTPAQAVSTAMQEGVDLIGVSVLSGAHLTVARSLLSALEEKSVGHIPVVIGGIIPPEDIPNLKAMGVKDVFTPGTSTAEIVARVKSTLDGAA